MFTLIIVITKLLKLNYLNILLSKSKRRVKKRSDKHFIKKSLISTWNFLSLTIRNLSQGIFISLKSVGGSPSKTFFYLLQWQSFKNDEKCFLFHLESFFRCQDIFIFVLTLWACRKNCLIRIRRLILKFMTSQPG